MQEVYNDAHIQIFDAQRGLNELSASIVRDDITSVVDNDDLTKIANSKANLLKVKENAIKTKLELAKLQADIIKHSGNIQEAIKAKKDETGVVTTSDFKALREILKNTNNDNNEGE
jgi:hypothetical protein